MSRARSGAGVGASAALVTLGCPKNLVDGEVMAAGLGRAGFILTGNDREADVIVVNTCAFIGAAREEAWEYIRRAADLRRNGRCRALIVAGCLAQGFAEEIRERFPEVDRVLGTGEVEAVAGAAADLVRRPPGDREEPRVGAGGVEREPGRAPGYLPSGPSARLLSTPGHYAYLKIAEGCSHKCAYCLIPTLRGPYRSRPPGDVVAEAKELAAIGVKELVLVAQDTTLYGRDLAGRPLLTPLVRRILAETDVAWVRTLYGYPSTLPDDFIALLAEAASEAGDAYPSGRPRLCRYLDLPMQHASDRVLRAMRRPETGDFLLRLVERLRRDVPGITIRSTFILGFPGETDADVNRLADFLEAARLDRVGFFTYSPEAGTPASSLGGQVPEAVKEERLSRMAALQKKITLEAGRELVGRGMWVIVDEAGSAAVARGERDAPEIDGNVRVRCSPGSRVVAGSFAEVIITKASGYDLLALPAGKTAAPTVPGR